MFQSWIRGLFQRPNTSRPVRRIAKRQSLRFQPALDHLEHRTVPTFLAPVSFTTGLSPTAVAVGDYNADGKDDLAIVNPSAASTVGILLSNGDGSFKPEVDYAAGGYAADAKAGDFNGDGKLDLAVVGSGNVSILLGNGDGSFAAPVSYTTGLGTHAVALGDFNNDGKLDVATLNSNTASVLLGNGDGSFQTRLDAALPGNNTNLVVGDFNKDGNLDLATSNTVSMGTITLLSGRGDGSFAPASNIYAYSAPVYVASGDFNHDGYDDFAVANSYAATSMSIVMNKGDGTYAPPVTYGIAATGYEIEVADFNNDGNEDYGVRGGSQYMIGYGVGDGTFFAAQNFATPVGRFENGSQHGDFNGDGATDLAYVSNAGVTIVMNANDNQASLAGATTFTMTTPATTTAGSALPMTITAVDADGKTATGFLGTVFVTTNDPGVTGTYAYTFTAADAGSHTFTGSVKLVTVGDQTVTVASPFMASATSQVTVTPAVSKFAISTPPASNAGDTITVTVTALDSLGNTGAGYTSTVHFTSADVQAGLPADYTFTAADAGSHTFTVTLKTAGGIYLGVNEVGGTARGGAVVNVAPIAASSLSLAGGSGAIGVARPVTVVAQDIYGNIATGYTGTLQLASSDFAALLPATVNVVNGTGTFNVTFLTVGTQTVTATDATLGLTGTLSSDATPPVAALFSVTGFPASTAGVAQNFTVTVKDTIGQTATGFTGTVYFSSSDVQAGLPASYTFTAADAGKHTFAATFKTAGIQTLRVQDSTGTLVGSQSGISVSSAAFSKFQLSVPNGMDSKGHILVTAGDAIALTVKATDAFGNAVAGYKGKVKFTSTDSLAGLPTDYSFTAADAGVHTFTVSLKTATPNGVVWSFNVVDGSNAATLATITNFEVVNAAAAKFVIAVPSNITAGVAFDLKITVLDAYGNKVKNYFGTIHFANTAGIAGLPADYTFTSVDSGLATLSVKLNTTGNQTISVTDLATPTLTASSLVSVKAATTTSTGGGGGGGGSGGGGGGGGGKKV